ACSAISRPLTTRFSPVLVLGTNAISDGFALMSDANAAFTAAASSPPVASSVWNDERASAYLRIAAAETMGIGCVYAPLMYVSPAGIAKSCFLGKPIGGTVRPNV